MQDKELIKPKTCKSLEEDVVLEEDLKLTDAERRILEFHLKSPEISKYEIAKTLSYSYATVWKAFKNPDFLGVITSVSKSTVQELALLAAKVVRDILLTSPQSVKLNCALSLLKNVGALTENKSNVQQAVIVSWAGDKKEPTIETTNRIETIIPVESK